MTAKSNRIRGGMLDVLMPMERCPICGREFLVYPDWGCTIVKKYRSNGNIGAGIKVCSIRCMRQYEDSQIE